MTNDSDVKPGRVTPDSLTFVDGFGEQRVLRRRVGGGMSVRRTSTTPILALNAEVSKLVGQRVTYWRQQRGLTLVELAERIGITSGHPKARMWAIENPGTRGTGEQYGGMRLGTVYALAIALDVPIAELLPSAAEVTGVASLTERPVVAVR